ncbi:hypothetical protein [Deinococcus cellulosilyticus]|uniref:Uncharacterized protein n=1 Tax=Deinococcus cellulosilyticus (strain DSM 18568 / NBRC 106333 / KACC 11606 / 5516J-15) TaxID=1223518 RepID=A0A511N770_DEIC1|nr:hypothetical protein [Deinococcus cellulosilyticus]GEM48699.1 hypothetical protein DC3_43340 [Deinococcus cellulosilyticus NBRC 106333 = KACC 11606]
MFPLTPQFLRDNYFQGVPLESPGGRPFTNEFIQGRILAVRRAFERKYAVRLEPTVIKMGSYPIPGEPEAQERVVGIDLHPDDAKDNKRYSMLLPVAPALQFHKLGLWLPGMERPTEFSLDWLHPNPPDSRTRQLRIAPGRSLTTLLHLQFLSGLMPLTSQGSPIPGAWHLTYTCGYTEDALLGQDFDVLDALAKYAAIALFVKGSLDGNVLAGITNKSLSADGLSQSVGLVGNAQALKFGAIINQYQQELTEWEKTYWARSSPIRMIGV